MIDKIFGGKISVQETSYENFVQQKSKSEKCFRIRFRVKKNWNKKVVTFGGKEGGVFAYPQERQGQIINAHINS